MGGPYPRELVFFNSETEDSSRSLTGGEDTWRKHGEGEKAATRMPRRELTRNRINQNLDLGFLNSRTVRKELYVV